MNQEYLQLSNVLAKMRNEPVVVVLSDDTEYRFSDFYIDLDDKHKDYEVTAWEVESVSDGKGSDMEFFEIDEICEIRDAISERIIYKKAS